MTVNMEGCNFKSEKKLIGYWRIFIKTYPWCFLICIPTDKHWVVIFDQRCVWRNHDFCSMSWFTRDCFFVQDKFVASMTTGHCACLVNRKWLKNKTQIVKKKTFRKKFTNKSEYIRNNFQIPYWHIEIYVDSYCKWHF